MITDGPQQAMAERLARRPWPVARISQDTSVSFEFFPPASADGHEKLARCANHLAPLRPDFVSVTYGAGGTTQERTHAAIRDLIKATDLNVAGHLTCVGATKEMLARVIDDYLDAGVRHIVALRGDPQEGLTDGTVSGGYRNAAELVAGVRRHVEDRGIVDVEISVGAYPEVHPRAASAKADMDNLKRKIDAGADRAITQFFYDSDAFLRFLSDARAAGIDVPIVPGIMPITNFAGVVRFAERCGTNVPDWMHELFSDLDDSPDIQPLVAATVAAEQCRLLAEHGVTNFHFYTMNRPELTSATCRILGVKPRAEPSSRHQQHSKVS